MVYPLLLLLLVGCAKVAPPTGGPVDRTPPQVVGHRPVADATAVPLDAAVEIEFSEVMDRERTETGVFTSPEGELRFRWSGRRLRLDMDLQAKRTYVITVGTDARDLRGNALEQSFTFAFATGDRLNQGQIAGFVYRDHQPVSGAFVWAYDLEGFQGGFGRAAPQYRTQSGQDGRYSFARLAASPYRLLAFADENRSREYDPGEWLALPAGDLEVSEADTARSGDLALVQHVPDEVTLERVQSVDSRRLLLEFSRTVDPAQVEVELRGLAVEELYGAPQDGRKVYARTAEQEAGREYSLARVRVDGQVLEWRETVRGAARPDRTPPQLVERFPKEDEIAPGDSLRMVFSEALERSTPAAFWLASDSTQALDGEWRWDGATVLSFLPADPLAPGEYRLRGHGQSLRDLAGLALEDSLVEFSFAVLAAEKLAALRGRVQAVGGPVRVTAQSETREYETWMETPGDFVLEGLVPGRYAVHAFADLDGDGKRGHGSLEPFVPAESYARLRVWVDLEEGQIAEIAELECR